MAEGRRKPPLFPSLSLFEPLRCSSEWEDGMELQEKLQLWRCSSDDFLLFPLTESHFLLFSRLTGCRPAASLFNSRLFPALTGSQMGK